jgi:transposase
MTHWSCRTLAASQGVSKSTIHNIWQGHHLQPHRVKGFKLSRDAQFLEKLTDVVGLYLNPPQQALVLCVDEKSQIQALDRTQPGLSMKKGRCGTMTHDYKRHGPTTLFAALEALQGQVIGQCYERHRHQEFLRFLRRLDQEFPGEIALHLVMDNYGTHKHPKVQAWLRRHPRFVAHFVPTSSSWLNLVERWFGELTSKRIRRGSFYSVEDLQQAIEQFLSAWNPGYLVSECTTMSAPKLNGRHRFGLGTVLSTISGTPALCAMSANACRSTTLPRGLPTLSTNTALVRVPISGQKPAGLSGSATRTSIPRSGRV